MSQNHTKLIRIVVTASFVLGICEVALASTTISTNVTSGGNLTISGSSSLATTSVTSLSITPGSNTDLRLYGSTIANQAGTYAIHLTDNDSSDVYRNGQSTFFLEGSGNINTLGWLTIGTTTATSTNANGSAYLNPSPYPLGVLSTTTQQWLFNVGANGYVGIGSSTPTSLFSIGSSSAGSISLSSVVGTVYNSIMGPVNATAGNTLFAVQSVGTMGSGGSVATISTAAGRGLRVTETGTVQLSGSSQTLQLSKGFGGTSGIEWGGGGDNNYIYSDNAAGAATTDTIVSSLYTRNAGALFAIENNTSRKMVVNYAGYVGIGTSTPMSALDVYGTTTIETGRTHVGDLVCYLTDGALGHMTQAALLAGAGSATCLPN